MISNWKELIVVLVIATAVFALARPLYLSFSIREDYLLRRNVWVSLTICAFLAPSFWLYAPIALLVLVWAAAKDSNPAVLYLVGYAIIPPISVYIPIVGINQLFALNQARLISIAVLLPLAIRIFSRNEGGYARKLNSVDLLLLAYTLLQLVLISPYESITNTMRRGFLFSIDTLAVYYVLSRSINTRRKLIDAMAAFVLIGVIYSLIGTFESTKGWLMYERIGPGWGSSNEGAFLLRADSLRAQASAGHSLTLGYTLSVAFGMWLYFQSGFERRFVRWTVTLIFCTGIYATHSRGPWLTAVLLYFIYLFLLPGSKAAFFKGLGVVTLAFAALAATPVGTRVIESLPFFGSVDQDNVLYRQRLAEESWRLVWQNPFLGDPFVAMRMEDLRQGQGIIDLVNAYAVVALYYGFVGLGLFAAFFILSVGRAYLRQRRLHAAHPDFSRMGVALIACMVASLFFMATAGIDWIEYVVAALLAAYSNLAGQALMAAQGPSVQLASDRSTMRGLVFRGR
ncbi:MAG: O-antigen ligase family protein [Acidobacteriota bacterium]